MRLRLLAIGSALALSAAWLAGRAVRGNAVTLETGLATATIATILATPHAYVHDLVLLAPVFVWTVARILATQSTRGRAMRGSGPRSSPG